jgi:hypothetical protein
MSYIREKIDGTEVVPPTIGSFMWEIKYLIIISLAHLSKKWEEQGQLSQKYVPSVGDVLGEIEGCAVHTCNSLLEARWTRVCFV